MEYESGRISSQVMQTRLDYFSDSQSLSHIKTQSVRGGALMVASQAVNFILQTASVVIVARLLSPADFGLVAMVTAVTGFVTMFKDAGLSLATIQREHITHEQVSTLFWINVTIGAVLMLAVSALAPVISWFYHDSRLIGVTLAIGCTFLVMGLGVQHRALLRRKMRFTYLAVNSTVSLVAGLSSAIVAAILGLGYWSLVIQIIVLTAVSVATDWIWCPWRPGRPHRNTGVRPMLAFGGNFAGFSCINYFARNADNILIGWKWGNGPLGLYSKAYQLLLMPLTQFKVPMESVAIPALSRLTAYPERYRNAYYREMTTLMWCCGPLVAILAACASETVVLVLGDQWGETAVVFKTLAATALFQPIYSATAQIFITTGRTDRQLRSGIVVSAILVTAFAIGLPFGIRGVAAGYSAAFDFVVLPWYFFYAFAGTPLSVSGLFRAIRNPLAVSLCIFAAAELMCRLLWQHSAITRIVGATGAASIVVVCILVVFRNVRYEVTSISRLVLGAINSRRSGD